MSDAGVLTSGYLGFVRAGGPRKKGFSVHFANEDMFVGTAGETTATLVPRPDVAAALAVVIMLGYAPVRPCDAAAQHAAEIGRRGPAT
jgi:hypothetical protein